MSVGADGARHWPLVVPVVERGRRAGRRVGARVRGRRGPLLGGRREKKGQGEGACMRGREQEGRKGRTGARMLPRTRRRPWT